jgi:NitT/TauT family transport system substrate-binding protein
MAIATERDLFAKHGVNVEAIPSSAYEEEFSNLLIGQTDATFLAMNDALLLDGREPNSIRMVLATDNSFGADEVVAVSEVKEAADLKGKRVAAMLGTFSELIIHQMLEKNNMTRADITLVDMNGEIVPDALPDEVQAGHIWEPYTSAALDAGAHVIFTSADIPGVIVDVFAFHTSVVEERPDDVQAVVEAWFEALAWWQANPAEGNAIIAKYTDLPVEEIAASAEGVKYLTLEENINAFKPGANTTSLYVSGQINVDFLIGTGGLTTAPDLERLFDASFLK